VKLGALVCLSGLCHHLVATMKCLIAASGELVGARGRRRWQAAGGELDLSRYEQQSEKRAYREESDGFLRLFVSTVFCDYLSWWRISRLYSLKTIDILLISLIIIVSGG
jgi:hypothetical protein